MSGSLASVSHSNVVSSAVNGQPISHGQTSGVQGSATPVRRLLTDLPSVIVGQIYTFLKLEDVVAGRLSSKALQRGFRLWEMQTGTLNAQLHKKYRERNVAAHGRCVDPQIVEEAQKAARAMQRLQLTSYRLNELETFFRSPRSEQDTVPLFGAHSLEISVGFSGFIGRQIRRGRRGGEEEQEKPITQERVDALFERILFHCSEITHLSLQSATDTACKSLLPRFPALTSVDLPEVQVSDWTIIPTLCHKLQRVSITHCNSCDDHMKQAATILPLWKLQIGLPVTDQGLAALARHPSLHEITCVGCQSITNDGIKQLATIPNLQTVMFGNCGKVDDLTALTKMPTLRSLHLRSVYSHFQNILASLRGSQLEDLTIEENYDFNDSCLKDIGTMSNLQHFAYSGHCAHFLTDKGIGELRGCKKLKTLTLGTTNFWDHYERSPNPLTEGMIDLIRQLPQLRELNLRNCGVNTVNADKVEE
ncbi:MAG: hypothetical protein ACHQT8_05670, partial [Chlamydiales bacterium]